MEKIGIKTKVELSPIMKILTTSQKSVGNEKLCLLSGPPDKPL